VKRINLPISDKLPLQRIETIAEDLNHAEAADTMWLKIESSRFKGVTIEVWGIEGSSATEIDVREYALKLEWYLRGIIDG
jgi:hypothetical protein